MVDMIDNEFPHQTNIFKHMIHQPNIPHCILECDVNLPMISWVQENLANIYSNRDSMKQHTLFINANIEHGIKSLRRRIQQFSKIIPEDNAMPLKFLIIMYADEMTEDAQSSIRYNIEQYSATTRFIFLCHNVNHLIDPIQSRCFLLPFGRYIARSKSKNTNNHEEKESKKRDALQKYVQTNVLDGLPTPAHVYHHSSLFEMVSKTRHNVYTMKKYVETSWKWTELDEGEGDSKHTSIPLSHLSNLKYVPWYYACMPFDTLLTDIQKTRISQQCQKGGHFDVQSLPYLYKHLVMDSEKSSNV